MERVVNPGLAGPAAVNAENAGRSRVPYSQESADADFADIFANVAAGGELRQDLAALHSWVTVPVGSTMSVITTPESLPDGAGLRDFAIAQGFDAVAVTAIFGAGDGARAAPQGLAQSGGAAHGAVSGDFLALEQGEAHSVSSGTLVTPNIDSAARSYTAGNQSPVTTLGRSGKLAVSALIPAADPLRPQGLLSPDIASQDVFSVDFSLTGQHVLSDAGSEVGGTPKSDLQAGNPRVAAPVLGAGELVGFRKTTEIARLGIEMTGQVLDQLQVTAPSDFHALSASRQASTEGAQTFMATMARPSTDPVSISAVIPASLHALGAGWHSGPVKAMNPVTIGLETGTEGPAGDVPVAFNGLVVRAAGETPSGVAGGLGGTASGNADVLTLDRLAAEAADERLGLLIAQRMLSGIHRGEWQIRLLLRPESLGEVEIQMRMQGGALEAHLSAAQESTKELLNQGLDRLRDYFQRSGMEVASIGVSAHTKGGGDGKPTGQSAGLAVKPAQSSTEEESASSPQSPVGGQSASQWDVLV